MGIKLRLAKWLVPEVFEVNETLLKNVFEIRGASNRIAVSEMRYCRALRKIAAQRTPRANATVNRMADMAEAELKREV